jgi:hypothetical protein
MKAAFLLLSTASATDCCPSFEDWASQYHFNGDEPTIRQNYETTVNVIEAMQADEASATFKVNQFSGMSWDDFAATMLTFRGGAPALSNVPMLGYIEGDAQDDAVDWDVTPVKDQGSCGSCWAFGTIGGIEAKHKQSTGATVSLSEQQLIDCDKSCDGQGTTCDEHCNCGCDGGQADWSYGNYLKEDAPTYTEESYPYKARNGQCQTGTDSGIRVIGFTAVQSLAGTGMVSPAMTDSSLAAAVTQGAVVVAVAANFQFQLYSGGVLSNVPTSCSLNHQVMVTGYGSNYWKIKNSWGSSWGENGFIRFARATDGCGPFGLLLYPGSIPTLAAEGVAV